MLLTVLTVLTAGLTGSAERSSGDACCLTGPLDLTFTVDKLSIPVSTPFTPGQITFYPFDGTTYSDNDFSIGEHTGTHLDAPFHFNNDSWTVAEIPVGRLVANGVFMNFAEETAGDPDFRLQPEHILRWMQRNGGLPDNAALIIGYGWAQRYHNRTLYVATDSSDFFEFRYPGMSCAAARLLAQLPQLVGLGVDTPSTDPPGGGCAHELLAARNVYGLENVDTNQACLPARGFTLYSLPMKLARGTGAPVRIVAVPGPAPAPARPPPSLPTY